MACKQWLIIDYIRTLNCDVIARTPEEGKYHLQNEDWECVCLGCGGAGYDVLCWAIENNCLPSTIQLVTSNPVGRDNMARALKKAGYVCSSTKLFWVKES